MKNNKQNYAFSQEAVDALMQSFIDDEQQFAKLSSPLVNAGVTSHEGDHSEN
jgi:hypothetical protein